MVDAKKGIVARALRSREFVERADGGAATARRGVVYMLKHGMTVMLKAINKRLAAAGLTPIPRNTLSALVAGKEYTQLKPDLCCCAACRDLGFVGYELLRQIVNDVIPSITASEADRRKLATTMIGRINEEERFRSGEFLGHLKEESSCAQHCLGLLCSSFNDKAFRCDCVHGRRDGRRREAPPTVEQQHPERAVRADDWQDACLVCYSSDESDTSSLFCCKYCSAVAHKACIVNSLGNDLPDATSEVRARASRVSERAPSHAPRESGNRLVSWSVFITWHVRAMW